LFITIISDVQCLTALEKGMKMLKKTFMLIVCFVFAIPFLSYGFDCNKPEFGARLEDLNKEGHFVKYMEKAGISYYNYTGQCKMDIHNIHNPRLAYAFIDNQLYARIVSVPGRDDIGSYDERKKKMEERISQQIGIEKHETKQDGKWTIFQWYNEKNNTKFKLKLNNETKENKTAFYYEPLRAKLPILKDEDDPVSLSE